jgi:ABC-type sugar transport system substrate-binding protein
MNIQRTLSRLALSLAAAGMMTAAMAETTVAYITNSNTNEGWTLINGGAKKAGQNSDSCGLDRRDPSPAFTQKMSPLP